MRSQPTVLLTPYLLRVTASNESESGEDIPTRVFNNASTNIAAPMGEHTQEQAMQYDCQYCANAFVCVPDSEQNGLSHDSDADVSSH